MRIQITSASLLLPPFTADDVLPPGDYALTIEQLRQSHLVTGEGNPSLNWDSVWRGMLVDNLEMLVVQLWQVGINRIFVDGSFVENKDHPNDIDGYFECDRRSFLTGNIQQALNTIDPFGVWTWNDADRRAERNSTKRQLPMWHHYRVELYPHYGQSSGIPDQFGNQQLFPAAFRKSRDGYRAKGIVQIIQ